jgi:hypothetical protein
MKRCVLAASLVIALAACNNQNQSSSSVSGTESQPTATVSDNAEAAVLEFAQSTYDFGKIKSGEKVSYDFKFKNTGKTPLIISDAQASCGCTVPDFPDEPIAPGEEGVIKAVFNSEGRSGKQNKVITITSNANPATTQIYLVGEVEEK